MFEFLMIFLFFLGIGAVIGLFYGLIRGLPQLIAALFDLAITTKNAFRDSVRDIKAICKPGPEGVEAAREVLNRDRQH